MTTITIINNLDKYNFNSHKRTTAHFNVWNDDGSVLYRNISLWGNLSKATCLKVISTNYLSDEEYFEQYKETRESGRQWVREKFVEKNGSYWDLFGE
ncbi:hypothetical protein [Ralstonia insidiosa]|uniref:hypothetical protein n=1 Tax=Ralstonia insidiosa TaxID=190721 RepID=UPI000B2B2F1A|nr:hypothetical protein [Ralstonia insidiosa]